MLLFGLLLHKKEKPSHDYMVSGVYQEMLPWLNMLKHYQAVGRQAEYEALADRLHYDFNLQDIPWGSTPENGTTLEDYPHVIEALNDNWGSRQCLQYLRSLLHENRGGARSGFPLAVFEEIALLAGMMESELRVTTPVAVPGVLATQRQPQTHPALRLTP